MAAVDITGHLLRPAEARRTQAGEWQLHIELAPPPGPKGKPRTYRAHKVFGTGEAAALACRWRASQLQRGVRVRVQAAGEDEARGASLLGPLEWLDAPDLQHPQHTKD